MSAGDTLPLPQGDYTEDDVLFFGGVGITLCRTPGRTLGFDAETYAESLDDSDNAVTRAKSRCDPQEGLGEAYATLLVPAIPAPDIAYEEADVAEGVLPPQLGGPVVKVEGEEGGGEVVYGVASGVRSGLAKVDGVWYRLKGCGNNNEGFVVREVDTAEGREKGLVNIRGSSFVHTSVRELYMTHRVAQVAEKAGMLSGNVPLAFYEYTLDDDPFPLVTKACSVFVTRGDRRLGDHILVGLERMLLSGWGEDALAAAVGVLSGAGRCGAEGEDPTPTFIQALMGPEGFVSLAGESSVAPLDVAAVIEASPYPAIAARVAEGLDNEGAAQTLVYLYHRFGTETGLFLRALHDADISWGTYVDSMGVHCNAHVNNLVVLTPGDHESAPAPFFLAPLDFDMAFTSQSNFCESDEASAENLVLEKNGMLGSLCGDEDLSTGVTGSALLPPHLLPLRIVLRDTAAAAFHAAYEGHPDALPYDPALTTASYALIKLALLNTITDIA